MESIKRNVEVEINATPEKVASLFCSMNAHEQAAFFNEIAEDIKTWTSCNVCLQMQYVSDSGALTYDARQIMKIIGDYSQKD